MRKKLFFILALLLTAVTGAWADEWDVVYWQTQTKQSDWTALSAGSTTGRTPPADPGRCPGLVSFGLSGRLSGKCG